MPTKPDVQSSQPKKLIRQNSCGGVVGSSDAAGSPASTAGSRNRALDLAKGGLVILMVLYHCASVSRLPETDFVRQRIHFLNFAFLAVTGFVCGWHYEHGQAPASAIRRRLRVRALKLGGVFLVANCIFAALSLGKGSLWDVLLSPDRIVRDFLLRVDGDYAAYEILWYITVFLLLAGVLARSRFLVPGLIVLVGLGATVPAQIGQFIAHGALGMLLGRLAGDGRLAGFAAVLRKAWWAVAMLAVLYFGILVGAVPHPKQGPLQFGVYVFETGLWCCGVVAVFDRAWSCGPWARWLAVVGTYSLLCYLVQMPLARIAHAGLNHLGIGGYSYYAVSVCVVGCLTTIAAAQTDQLRRRFTWFDRMYAYVFA